jgi:hypothetical protein
MSTTVVVPIAVLRVVAWLLLFIMEGYGLYLLLRAFVGGGNTVGIFGSLFSLLASVPFLISGVLSWAFLMAFAGGVEALLELRDMKRAELRPDEEHV